MNAMTTERCRFKACSGRIIWATSATSGKSVPLNADPVDPGTRNAQVLIGNVAHSRVLAVQRLGELFSVDEPTAYRMALEDYGWHLSHFATCPFRDQARRSR